MNHKDALEKIPFSHHTLLLSVMHAIILILNWDWMFTGLIGIFSSGMVWYAIAASVFCLCCIFLYLFIFATLTFPGKKPVSTPLALFLGLLYMSPFGVVLVCRQIFKANLYIYELLGYYNEMVYFAFILTFPVFLYWDWRRDRFGGKPDGSEYYAPE
jgi:hypothetical protein